MKKPQKSLKNWTKEEWDYTGKPGKSRYLPKAARESLTPAQKAAGSRKKNAASKKGKQNASYTKAERSAVRRARRG